ncbi:hypothetical protein [Rubinisphaera sp.]|uniref:hypothetical protein n=1 Tax=Rubinisphaera sp. TaxID=2024857 RepID=UPI000C0E653A|nr:hypothetical protein [Rubinisphaera sp.]MBV11371.1 hypothetical protein [Rubinisphaera sp.]HCS52399.1 hypothetical protein [Planctomycetaceae bacterium]
MKSFFAQILCVSVVLLVNAYPSSAEEYEITITSQRGGSATGTSWNPDDVKTIVKKRIHMTFEKGGASKQNRGTTFKFDETYTLDIKPWELDGLKFIFIYVDDTAKISQFSDNGNDHVASGGWFTTKNVCLGFNDSKVDTGGWGKSGFYRYQIHLSPVK